VSWRCASYPDGWSNGVAYVRDPCVTTFRLPRTRACIVAPTSNHWRLAKRKNSLAATYEGAKVPRRGLITADSGNASKSINEAIRSAGISARSSSLRTNGSYEKWNVRPANIVQSAPWSLSRNCAAAREGAPICRIAKENQAAWANTNSQPTGLWKEARKISRGRNAFANLILLFGHRQAWYCARRASFLAVKR